MGVYSSAAASGYSFNLSGLESGTFAVSSDQPVAFGSCGLFAKFTANSRYSNSTWIIDIPNVSSANYTQNSNTFDKVEREAQNAIAAATDAVTLAQNKQQLENAAPRSEALTRANARINQAEARIAEITAQIGDRAIIAPFTGVVTMVDILAGETAGTKSVITLLGTEAFELTARIPEIDVPKISTGQQATVIFDAKRDEPVAANITYIAPVPTQINGVAYFEIKLALSNQPAWVRTGFNADIDIITAEEKNALIVPNRYLITSGVSTSVLVLRDQTIINTPVQIILRGTDGQIAITGVTEGSTIVTP
jgi:multidrug efflux pump subunit AcrA (membrane-fusion protein)